MKALTLLIAIVITSLQPSRAIAEVFSAHCRNYLPELSFDGEKCIGPIPDLATDILHQLGHEIKWSKVPWIRSLKAAQEGSVDLMIRHSMTDERHLILDAATYGSMVRKLAFYRSPQFKQPIDSYQDVKKYNLGAIRGVFYSPTFSLLDTNILTLVSSTEQLIKMLERGRIDIAVTSASHSEELFKGRFDKVEFVDTFFNPMYISIPKKSTRIKYFNDIAALLLEFRKQNKIEDYYKKYNLTPPKQEF